ncbi:MAG TPA: hydroxylamine reductase [Candidatus Enterocloster faecavium]|uniref:Hydroxylamine reductase n=1 Tax=Candidatus Enterocloster faecavium TaxID=2838560 RepID=A0A9D2RKQ7_9FIRM|nr:hydroxylamine reductase [Candidatus Enterocloster faecavium]
MERQMFCFQCEQTAGCTGCTGKAGVCGKTAPTAALQDELTGALIGLARASADSSLPAGSIDQLLIQGLFTTVTNVNFNEETIRNLIRLVHEEKERLVPDCSVCGSPCGRTEDYDLSLLWNAPEDIRSLKSLILFGIRGVGAYAYHAMVLGYTDEELNRFIRKALFAVGEDWGMEELLPVVLEVGKYNLACMELLDRANTETFGTPAPTEVSMKVEKGPFIVVTGHDLLDLKLLLEQTEGKGINIYTHGEMLPAHGYPELKKYPHLKGNFGTAWQNQQKEFDDLPAPILFTTNCLMPPKASYADRVFTTEVVSYPEIVHIGPVPGTEVLGEHGAKKDFTPVIEKALALGGYPEDRQFTGINGGETLTTGFGHGAVLSAAPQVVEAVKSGAIRHFFLVGGCDGARPGRNYYTEFVKLTPPDTLVLTLACGKYRFNDLDLGTIGGLPRLMDIGQCNDAYSAIRIALALAEAFGCGVNDLPLSLVLSWYEQKAVCILLTLLHLGIKNIRLGPTLPAFLSPNVLDYLVEHYNIAPITTPEEDLKAML